MASKQPTPQGISSLLASAGFDRGVSNPPERACAGYAVIPNRPDDGIVLVNWWDSPDDCDLEQHALMLRRYAEVLQINYAVHPAGALDNGPEWLIVTAREAARG